MNTFDPQLTGKIASAIPLTAVLSIITLALLYSGIPIFGPINDLTNAVSGVLIAVMVGQFHFLFRERAAGVAVIFLLVAFAGAATIVINSVLVAFGRMHWLTGGMYTAIGYGLIGVWFFVLLRTIVPQPFLTPGLIRLGTVTTLALLFCLPAAPLMGLGDNLKINPLIIIVFFGAGTGWLLFPFWCWQLGRRLISS
ncbi:MAG TPA: hypothetical protein VK851_01230 [Anaerolineales bacterium]|nr:hypothetical protein [Anaerolineales bacterium]